MPDRQPDHAILSPAPSPAAERTAVPPGAPFIAPETDAQAPARGNQYVLKACDAFVVTDALGDIGGRDDGFFVDDMRVLSHWRLTFGGRAPSLLSGATSADNASFTAHLTNRPLPPLGGHETPEGVIHIERMRVLADNVLYEALTLTNYGASEAEVPLSLSFAADFKDIFEVRGTRRDRRGHVVPPCLEAGSVHLRYDGLDGVERSVAIRFSPAPDAPKRKSAQRASAARARTTVTRTTRPWPAAPRCGWRSSVCTARCASGAWRWRACAPVTRCSTRGSTARSPILAC